MAAGRSKEMEIAIKIGGKVASSFKSAIGQATKGIGGIAKAVGAATSAAAAAVGAMGMAAINVGREFEGAMSQVAATMLLDKGTAEGQKAFGTLENAARECGASTAFSATEAAEALNYLALAGYDADAAATALPTVLKLAGAGAMELAQASDMVTDSMSALGIEATEANLTQFSDQMAKTASKSNTSVAQLGEAILTVGGTAKGLAGGTTELNAALGILADNGIKAAEGGTHLRNMILSLQSARNSDAAALFEQMGISAYDAEGNMRSLGEVFKDINNSLAGASADKVNSTLSTIFKQTDLASARAMLAATVDSVDALGAVMDASLAGSGTSMAALGINLQEMAENFDTAATQEAFAAQMMEQFGMTSEQAGTLFNGLQSVLNGTGNRFGELTAMIEDSAGACEDMYANQLDNLNGDIDILKSGLSDLGISVYKGINAPLRETVQLSTNMVGKLSAAYKGGGMDGMVAAVGGCLAEALDVAAGYAPELMGMGVNLLSSFINGITADSGALTGAAADVISVFVEGIFTLVPQAILAGADILAQFAQSMAAQIPRLISTGSHAIANFVSGLIQRLPEIISAALMLVQALVDSVGQNAPLLINAAIQLIGNLVIGMASMFPQLIQMGVQLILSLAQGLLSNLPQLLQMGTQMVIELISGLTQMLPTVIQGGIQLIISLIQGIIANLGNIVQSAAQIVIALAVGLVQAIPQLIAAIPQLVGAIIDTILSTDWLSVGIQIIKGLIDGILSTGKSLWSAIKSLFTGGGDDIPDTSSQSAAVVDSYASGISSKIGTVTAAANSMAANAFSGMDTSGASAAGTQAGTAFSAGLTESIASGGLNAEDFHANMMGIGTAGAAALNTGLNTGLAETPVNTGGILDGTVFSADMMAVGTDGAAALADGLNTGLAGTPISTSGLVVDTSGLATAMAEAGANGVAAIGSGMAGNSQTVAQTAAMLGNGVNTALDSGWGQAKASAQAAMQDISTSVANAARAAAGAVKSAFENMSITIPKPRVPSIEVASSSVPYGNGGNVSVPKFSVKWNALGGIFNRPTIFSTQAGMQGVGEAGAEAVLPLDTLWAKMEGILSNAMAVNSGGSAVDALMQKLKGAVAGMGRPQPEPAGAGMPGIVWSPTYNLYGSAGKAEIAEAGRMGMAEFRRMMKQYEKDLQRRRL